MTSNSFQARQPGSNPAWIVMVTGFNRVLMGISKLIMWLMMFLWLILVNDGKWLIMTKRESTLLIMVNG